jgi:acetyl esterase/lipase
MSLRNRAISLALRRFLKPGAIRNQDVAHSRRLTSRVPFAAKLAPGWRIRPGDGPPLAGEWIEPAAPDHSARRRCILFCHGGAYIAMSSRTHRVMTSRLAAWSDATVFALDYRLAPEHPFPAALDDAVAAYRALLGVGFDAAGLAVAGDSAGGGLALALLLALRDAGEPLPAAAAVFSPWTDMAATGDSIVANDSRDAMFYGNWVKVEARHYLQETPATHPLASPLYADLAGLPPLFIQVSDSEVLLDDSHRFFEKARAAGVEATLQIWRDVPHDWQMFAPVLPEGRDALRRAAAFLAGKLR